MTPNKNQRHEASIGTAKNTGTFTCKSSMEGPFLEKHYGPPDEDNGTLPKNSPWNPNEWNPFDKLTDKLTGNIVYEPSLSVRIGILIIILIISPKKNNHFNNP